MSIRDEINRHLGKELSVLKPLIPSQKVGRTMFISKEINAVAHPPWAASRNGDRLAKMRAWLDAFVEGRKISVSENPDNHPRETFMARTKPVRDQVFDIRCIEPIPGIRVFGRFVELDTFIALTWEHREHINGREFDRAVERCIEQWRKLFPAEPLFSGKKLNDYLTNYYPV